MTFDIRLFYTFYIVARAGTMQGAAQILSVTPGAISQRVKMIEQKCGKQLFKRVGKGVELTRAGQVLWAEVENAFGKIESAYNMHIDEQDHSRLRISAPATFAHSTLVKHLGAFTQANPSIKIAIETEDRLVDLHNEPIDLCIRHGLGAYQGLRSEWLSSPELIVVGSPALLSKGVPINTAQDCLTYPLLQRSSDAHSDWDMWCKARQLDSRPANYVATFKEDFLIVKAAVEGQGLALINDINVRDEINSNQLTKACNAAWPVKFAYYAVALPNTFKRPAVQKFVTWLKSIATN